MRLLSGWFYSLNGRLVFFWLVGSLIPVLLLGGTTAFISSYYLREQALRFASDMAQEKAQSIINLQNPVVSVSSYIVSDSNMLDVLFEEASDSSISEIRINALIETNLAHYFSLEGLTAISLILNEGRTYSLSLEVEVTSIDSRLFESQVTLCPHLSESNLCWPGIQTNINQKSRHTQVIPAIRKVYRLNEESMQEEHVGYLYMAFATDSFREMLMKESSHEMRLMVLDRTERIIYHDNPAFAGLPVESNLLPEKDGEPYRTKINGEPFFLVSHSSNISQWRFIIMVPEKQVLQGMYQTLFITLGLIILSLVFIFVAWINIRRRVLRPLQALSIAMRETERSISGYQEDKNELREIQALYYWYDKYVEIVEHRDLQTEQLQEAYDELKLAQDQLIESEKMAALGELVAGVAHEINTPLGVSLTSSTFTMDHVEKLSELHIQNKLKRSDLDKFIEESKEGIEITIKNLYRVTKLVNVFKTLAIDQHIEEFETFSLAEYLDDTAISLSSQLSQKNIALEWTCDSDITIRSYPGVLWQILSNLILNSLAHGYENADKGKITIDVQIVGSFVSVTYRDDGSGMNKEVKDNIFLPFYTTKRFSGRVGLGMHIVYNMVAHKLNGSIHCNSELGHGTEFILTLPRNLKS